MNRFETVPRPHVTLLDDSDPSYFNGPYKDKTIHQLICNCGCELVRVFIRESYFSTWAECPKCGLQEEIHSG